MVMDMDDIEYYFEEEDDTPKEEDHEVLYTQLQDQHHILSIKRKWLMGLALTDSEQEQFDNHDNKNLRESLLRKDDVFYDNLTAHVAKGFVALNCGRDPDVNQDSISTFNLPPTIRQIPYILDDMTPTGLLLVAKVLVSNSFEFDQTKPKMKKVIKQHFRHLLKNMKAGKEKTRVEELGKIMKNPQNFVINISEVSNRAAAVKILEGLEDLDLDLLTLKAMVRKLTGVKGYIPQLQPPSNGAGNRPPLIEKVKHSCTSMLSELRENNELPEPVAKAMAVASLSINLKPGSPSMRNFLRFSPEIMALQNQIAKAIRIVAEKKRLPLEKMMKGLGYILPIAEISKNSQNTKKSKRAVTVLLTEFLLECSDLDPVPESLLKTVAMITSESAPSKIFSKNDIEEEVEAVLCVGAQMRQVWWDFLPEEEYNEDFADAYMEDLEDSDEEDYYTDSSGDVTQGILFGGRSFGSREGYDHVEGTGQTSPPQFNNFSDTAESRDITKTDLMKFSDDDDQSLNDNTLLNPFKSHLRTAVSSSSSSCLQLGESLMTNHAEKPEYRVNPEKSSDLFSPNTQDRALTLRNHYLDVQEACDKTSVVAHELIGRLLEKFAESDGRHLNSAAASYLRGDNLSCNIGPDTAAEKEHIQDKRAAHGSVVFDVLEEILPSFPGSGKEKVKEILGLK